MREPNLRKWRGDNDLEGLLFFAQLLEEMLFHFSLDSYRVPALNTRLCCIELNHCIYDVARGLTKKGAISPIVDELLYFIESDTVAQKILSPFITPHLINIKKLQNNTEELNLRIDHIYKLLKKDYYEELKKELEAAISNSKEKRKIVKLTRLLATEILSKGWSQEGLYYIVRQFFFQGSHPTYIEDQLQILDFFNELGRQDKTWNVLFRGTRQWKYLREIMREEIIKIRETAPAQRTSNWLEGEWLRSRGEFPIFILVEDVEAKDPTSARIRAQDILDTLANISNYIKHDAQLKNGKSALIYSKNYNKVIMLNDPLKPILHARNASWEEVKSKLLPTMININEERMDMDSRIRLFTGYELHASAIKSSRSEEQFLHLWTSIESLIPRKTKDDIGNIEHVLENVIPFLSLPYFKNLFEDALNNVINCCGTEGIEIIEKINVDQNRFDKFVALLCTDRFGENRDNLYSIMDGNPLLRFRLYSLSIQLNQGEKVSSYLASHERRIRWHLQRIYRSRNLVVHSGKKLPYLDMLVENMHFYLDLIFDGIERLLRRSVEERHDLDKMFSVQKYTHEAWLQYLEENKKEACTVSNINKMLFPLQSFA